MNGCVPPGASIIYIPRGMKIIPSPKDIIQCSHRPTERRAGIEPAFEREALHILTSLPTLASTGGIAAAAACMRK